MKRTHISFAICLMLLLAGGAVALFWLKPGPRAASHNVPPPIAQENAQAPAPFEFTQIYPPQPQETPKPAAPAQPETPAPEPVAAVEPGTITGRVVDGGGVPIAGTRVYAIIQSPGESVTTDQDGYYSFTVPPGKWRLLIGTKGEIRLLSQPGEAVVVSGEETIATDFVIGAPVTVTVRLLDQSGVALSNKDPSGRWLHVVGTFTSPDGYTARMRATVDSAGVATFADVPVDARELSVNAIGYTASATTYLYLRNGEINDAGEVRLTALDLPAEPLRTGSVRGRVVDPEGKPLAGVTVFAHPASKKERFGETFRSDDQTTTDAEGTYSFPALEVGTWYFIIASSEYTVKVNPGNVTIEEGVEAVVAKNFVLGPPTGLKFRLLGAEGKAVKARTEVRFVLGNGDVYQSYATQTDEDGVVTIKGLRVEEVRVKIAVPGYRDVEEFSVRLIEGQLTDGGDVQLVAED